MELSFLYVILCDTNNYSSLNYVGVCPELSSPAYGNVNMTGQRVEDYATYTCDSGFELDFINSSEVRICQADGMWSGYPPACVRKSF